MKEYPNKIKHIACQIEFDHACLIMNNTPINIYIIGSLSQADFIKKLAEQLKKENSYFNVKHVHEKKKTDRNYYTRLLRHNCVQSSHHCCTKAGQLFRTRNIIRN